MHIKRTVTRVKEKLSNEYQNRFKRTSFESLKSNAQKRVIVLSQFYRPEPFKYPRDIARALVDNDYEVRVVTGYPNRPGGKLYSQYRQRLRFTEMIDGIPIHRVPILINHSRKAVERIVNFLSFSLTALTVTKLARNADAIYVYATPATAAIPAQIWRKLFRIPYVLHVQDLWPESVTGSGMMGKGRINRFAETVLSPWLSRLYGQADAVVAISPGMRELLIDRGNDADSSYVVYNWAEEETISAKASGMFSEKRLRLLYAGNLGPMQDLETVIQAARRFHDQTDFSLEIAGGGILEEKLRLAAQGSTNIEFLGLVPRDEIGNVYFRSDFQLVTLKDIPIFRTTVPSKLQASLAAGVPVITTVKGDVARLIQEFEAGLVAEPEDIDSLATVFEIAINMSASERARMGMNARRLYEERMSRKTGTSAMVSILNQVSGKRSNDIISRSSLDEFGIRQHSEITKTVGRGSYE